MGLEHLKRWQWMGLGLLLGLVCGLVSNVFALRDLEVPADSINTPEAFESLLLRPITIKGVSQPQWKSVRVVRGPDPRDSSKLCYIVTGEHYVLPHPIYRKKGESPEPRLESYLYKAPQPYVTRRKFPTTAPAATASGLYKFAESVGLKDPDEKGSVVDFLEQVKANQPGFSYQYQWWRGSKILVAMWTLGGFVVVGGIWPFIVSLIVYRRLIPPPPPPEEKRPEPTPEEQLPKARPMIADIESDLAKASVDPAALQQDRSKTEFAQKEDDFYPTERHQK